MIFNGWAGGLLDKNNSVCVNPCYEIEEFSLTINSYIAHHIKVFNCSSKQTAFQLVVILMPMSPLS